MRKIILASSSPRRKALLKTIVDKFDIIPSEIIETYPPNLDLLNVALHISNLKAYNIYKKYPNALVIGCDTTIVINDKVLGKPSDKDDARKMLMELSGKMHYVVTGVTIYSNDHKYEINSINKVYFKNLNTKDIEAYLNDNEYKDKAGSYAIQGKAHSFIEKIDGEYEAIVGLPIKQLKSLLDEIK